MHRTALSGQVRRVDLPGGGVTALRPVLDALPGAAVLVVGDALLDDYLHGAGTRICREAPVPVVTVTERRPVPGGAGNVAANAAALGGRLRLLSVVGDDAAGGTLTDALVRAGVAGDDVLVEPGRSTVVKRRVMAGEQMLVRIDEGEPAPLQSATRAAVLERLPALFAAADVVVVSDYGYGLLDDEVVAALAALQRATPRVLVVDAREVGRYREVGATAVTPSFDEVRALLTPAAPGADRADRVVAECARLHDATGAALLAVTLDRDGAVVCERGRPAYRTWTRPVPHSRACGAGDSFTSALALALAAGADAPVAAELAQAAAQVVTGRDGTSTCSLDDLREHLAETTTRLAPVAALAERVAFHRRQGRRVVFTNGCFDLLHRGHIDLLNRAKALGDVLVVGINSDASMRELKGPERPINRLEDRAQVLAALSAVDHLVAFDAPTARELVELLQPDVYVKGGDYTADMVPEAPHVEAYGGRVLILPYLEDRSTTALIERIRGDALPYPELPFPEQGETVEADR
jgi:D-beta-D-heptose 7-phosphate kinase/D-beta-D-heptose 1-phosphate adenosyltransferase